MNVSGVHQLQLIDTRQVWLRGHTLAWHMWGPRLILRHHTHNLSKVLLVSAVGSIPDCAGTPLISCGVVAGAVPEEL